MTSLRAKSPPVNLKERIAALEQRTNSSRSNPSPSNAHTPEGVRRSVSPAPLASTSSPSAAALRDKIARFEKKGGVPVPRGSFGLGAPPMAENGQQRRRGELYGNRIPTPLRSGAITPTLTGNTLLNGIPTQTTGRSVSPMPTGSSVGVSRAPTLNMGQYSEADVVEVGGFGDTNSPIRALSLAPSVSSPVHSGIVEGEEEEEEAAEGVVLREETSPHRAAFNTALTAARRRESILLSPTSERDFLTPSPSPSPSSPLPAAFPLVITPEGEGEEYSELDFEEPPAPNVEVQEDSNVIFPDIGKPSQSLDADVDVPESPNCEPATILLPDSPIVPEAPADDHHHPVIGVCDEQLVEDSVSPSFTVPNSPLEHAPSPSPILVAFPEVVDPIPTSPRDPGGETIEVADGRLDDSVKGPTPPEAAFAGDDPIAVDESKAIDKTQTEAHEDIETSAATEDDAQNILQTPSSPLPAEVSDDDITPTGEPFSLSVTLPSEQYPPQTPKREAPRKTSLALGIIATPGPLVGLAYDDTPRETPRPSPSGSPSPAYPSGVSFLSSARSSVRLPYLAGSPDSPRPHSMIELSTTELTTAQRVSPTTSHAVALYIPGSKSPRESETQEDDQKASLEVYSRHKASRSFSALSLNGSEYMEPDLDAAHTSMPSTFSATVHRKVKEHTPSALPLRPRAATETPHKRVRDSYGKEPWSPNTASELTKLVAESALLEQLLLGGEIPAEVKKPLRPQTPPTQEVPDPIPKAEDRTLALPQASLSPEHRRPMHMFRGALSRSKSEHRPRKPSSSDSPPKESRHLRVQSTFPRSVAPFLPQLKVADETAESTDADADADEVPPTPPPKSPSRYLHGGLNGLRRLATAPPRRMPGAYPRDSGSMSSEPSSEDSVTVITPPEHTLDFVNVEHKHGTAPARHIQTQSVSEFGDLRSGIKPRSGTLGSMAQPQGLSSKKPKSFSRAASFAGKMWQRARTKSGASTMGYSGSGSDHSHHPMPTFSQDSLPQLDPIPIIDVPIDVDYHRLHGEQPQPHASSSKALPAAPFDRPMSWVSVSSSGSARTTDIFDAFPSVPEDPRAAPLAVNSRLPYVTGRISPAGTPRVPFPSTNLGNSFLPPPDSLDGLGGYNTDAAASNTTLGRKSPDRPELRGIAPPFVADPSRS
ncbi:hypothetical protein HGRIS_012621 [Hohenbuehelia grisea]|uniref:Uncharacterized protein n=1 Tax=Hohenbuehelia grisea TaxID=104357 RepID=A0ABR3ISX1_9AGAR